MDVEKQVWAVFPSFLPLEIDNDTNKFCLNRLISLYQNISLHIIVFELQHKSTIYSYSKYFPLLAIQTSYHFALRNVYLFMNANTSCITWRINSDVKWI